MPIAKLVLVSAMLVASTALVQEDPFTPKAPTPGDFSEHPFGKTPLARMITLAHTNAFGLLSGRRITGFTSSSCKMSQAGAPNGCHATTAIDVISVIVSYGLTAAWMSAA